METFKRNLDWAEKRNRNIEEQRFKKHLSDNKELIFKPNITPLKLRRKDTLRSISPQIPHDNKESRQVFKKINGMERFLERQY